MTGAPCPLLDAVCPALATGIDRADDPAALPACRLLDPAGLTPVLARFQAGSGGSWPAACSLWSQFYFNALLIPGLCLLAEDRLPDLRLSVLRVSLSADTALPARFHLPPRPAPDLPRSAAGLIDGHLSLLIAALGAVGGLSCRLLWENCMQVVDWTLNGIARVEPDRGNRLASVMVRAIPCAVAGTLGVRNDPGARPPRRLCCLRDQIPGFAPCPAICPKLRCRVDRTRPGTSTARTARPSRPPP